MSRFLRRALPAALGVLLTGCSTAVVGLASPAADSTVDVPAADFPITGVGDEPIDQFARNALADLNTFWAQAYPDYFGEEFAPLSGGYFSVGSENPDDSAYPDSGIGCTDAPETPDSVAGNAYYDFECDLIAYDRDMLAELATD
ncbi:MAG TPA: hypothetical protein VGD12_00490, partial [Blastococcus sp.]